LRVLAEREVVPVGATQAVPVDIRVIAATHAELQALVREGRFRDDLYYRLAGARLHLPPLRERRDSSWLLATLLEGAEAPARLSPQAEALLLAYRWPGNLRELHNVLGFAAAVCEGGVIEVGDLPDHLHGTGAGSDETAGPQPVEAQLLLQYLRAARWNVSAVAHQMGLARMTVYRRMKRWGIVAPNRVGSQP
jgi:transcriptional regulator of acetoin/glycerol metabolism